MPVTLLDYAIISLADLKVYLELSSSAHDEMLKTFINAVTEYVESYLGRRIKYTTYTNQLVSGKNESTIYLTFPIDSAQTFTLEKNNGTQSSPNWDEIDADNYEVDYASGMCRLIEGSTFVKGFSNYRVSYKAGYNTVPDDIEYAAVRLIKKAWDRKNGGDGIAEQELGSYRVVFNSEVFANKEIKSILDAHKTVKVA